MHDVKWVDFSPGRADPPFATYVLSISHVFRNLCCLHAAALHINMVSCRQSQFCPGITAQLTQDVTSSKAGYYISYMK